MAVMEGRGKVAPAPIRIRVTNSEIRCIVEYGIRQTEFRDYSNRRDGWGRGLMSRPGFFAGKKIPIAATSAIVGMVGEFAVRRHVCSALKIPEQGIDMVLRKHGDGGVDWELYELQMQIKTRRQDYQSFLIRCRTATGRAVPLTAHVHIFCEWDFEDDDVRILGWERNRAINEWKVQQSPFGHWNLVGESDDLHPLCRLVADLEARKILRAG